MLKLLHLNGKCSSLKGGAAIPGRTKEVGQVWQKETMTGAGRGGEGGGALLLPDGAQLQKQLVP